MFSSTAAPLNPPPLATALRHRLLLPSPPLRRSICCGFTPYYYIYGNCRHLRFRHLTCSPCSSFFRFSIDFGSKDNNNRQNDNIFGLVFLKNFFLPRPRAGFKIRHGDGEKCEKLIKSGDLLGRMEKTPYFAETFGRKPTQKRKRPD